MACLVEADVPLSAWATCIALWSRADADGDCHPSDDGLAKLVPLSASSFYRLRHQLRDAGFLDWQVRVGTTNAYHLSVPPAEVQGVDLFDDPEPPAAVQGVEYLPPAVQQGLPLAVPREDPLLFGWGTPCTPAGRSEQTSDHSSEQDKRTPASPDAEPVRPDVSIEESEMMAQARALLLARSGRGAERRSDVQRPAMDEDTTPVEERR